MANSDFQSKPLYKIGRHVLAIVLMFIVSAVFFSPVMFENKTMMQSDNMQSKGAQKEIMDYRAKGESILWTNAMFSGMPAYQIWMNNGNVLNHPYRWLRLGGDITHPQRGMFLLMLGVYLFLVVLKVDWMIALMAGIGFGLSTQNLALFEAGHSTKVMALSLVAPVFLGFVLLYRRKYWLGTGLLALFFAFNLIANHVQITFYMGLTLLAFGVVYLVYAIKEKEVSSFVKTSGIALLVVFLAVATSTSKLWTTYEYSKETIRGKSELIHKTSSSGSDAHGAGLSKDYAFAWSQGILESFNFLIPNYMGWSSSKAFANEKGSKTLKALRKMGGDQQQVQQLARASVKYWGAQPFTSSPHYFGIIIVLLFFIGAFLLKGPLKVWLVSATVLTIMLAWGKHFSSLNYFLFDHFPMMNKFRAVNMALSLASITSILLAGLGLQKLIEKSVAQSEKNKAFLIGSGITAGLVIIGWIVSFGLDFGVKAGMPKAFAEALQADRAAMLTSDVFRALGFLLVGVGALWLFLKEKLPKIALLSIMLVLVTVDFWTVGTRLITKDSFHRKSRVAEMTAPSAANKQINKDKDPHYRVADFSRALFNNSLTSYHHKSIGGYHAAKLMIYQELYEKYLQNPNNSMPLYNMLNTKYFITQDGKVSKNPANFGNAWFVKNVEIVATPDDEIEKVGSIDPKTQLVVSKKYATQFEGFQPTFDDGASIKLTTYHPDHMVYDYTASSEQIAVFSEVYYPPSKGWKMLLDGKPYQDFTKGDYVLRALKVPAGTHKLEMVFQPKSFYTGDKITLMASLLVVLLFGAGIYFEFFRKEKKVV